MDDLQERVNALEKTVRDLSDRLEIFQIVASYAPSFDSGSGDILASAWVEDGVFDIAGVTICNGRADIVELTKGTQRSPAQREAIARGAGHVLSMPFVTLKGDTAVATCTSRFYMRDGDGYRMARLTVARMELIRTSEGWRIERRLNRVMDESGEGRALYRAALED